MLLKIILSVLVAFLLAFSGVVYAIYEIEPDNICRLQNDFYSQKLPENTKKIFIIGSSHTDRLNNTHISEIINDNKLNYDVYNLSIQIDSPSERFWSLEKIILLKPELVVYGISFRDFTDETLNSSFEKPSSILPDTHDNIDNLLSLEKNLPFCVTSLKDTKLASLKIIRDFMGQTEKIESRYTEEKMPFVKYYTDSHFLTKSYEEIKKHPKLQTDFPGIILDGKDVKALNQFVKELHENNIRVILFTTPNHELYLDRISESDKQGLRSILENLHEEFNISIYFLHDKYSNLNIWNDHMHVAKNKEGLIYSEDIAEIIINEVD